MSSTADSEAAPSVVVQVEAAVSDAVGDASDQAMRFAAVVVVIGLGLSFLIPRGPVFEVDRAEVERERESELLAEATTIQ